MSRNARLAIFWVGGGCLFALLALAFLDLQPFGGSRHPYRDRAVAASVAHQTANAVSSVNFDQRAIDTLGEESILFASVIGVAALLRPARREEEDDGGHREGRGDVLASTQLASYVVLAVTLVLGLDLVAHGHVSPGGGFQGGVVLATGVHLVYVGGRYRSLRQLRPLDASEWAEAFGAAGFALLGVVGILMGASFLSDVVPAGSFGSLLSSGTVAILNGVVAVEVAGGMIVLVAKFLSQAIEVRVTGGGNG